ncbi:MAG: hypothetical protein PHW04_03760 [Candidatus Wallbacteria bacterium]|nr:hypothetical protein [Candidatus Wallbacteria bacterium]
MGANIAGIDRPIIDKNMAGDYFSVIINLIVLFLWYSVIPSFFQIAVLCYYGHYDLRRIHIALKMFVTILCLANIIFILFRNKKIGLSKASITITFFAIFVSLFYLLVNFMLLSGGGILIKSR